MRKVILQLEYLTMVYEIRKASRQGLFTKVREDNDGNLKSHSIAQVTLEQFRTG